MSRRWILVSIFMAGLVAASCATSPPVRFYGLEPITGDVSTKSAKVLIGVGPLSFPEYLDRPQIVTRAGSMEFKLAEFDRWAEPVESAFQRVLVTNLDGWLASANVISYPFGSGLIEVDYRVIARVTRFDVDQSGTAVLNVQWGIGTPKGQGVVAARRSEYKARAANPDSYDSIVAALNDTLQAFSRDVANAFQTATAK